MNWTKLGLMLVQLIPALVGKFQKTKADAPGAEKKADVMDLAASILQSVEVIAGKDLINDLDVSTAISHYIDATVALKNAIASARAKHQTAAGLPTDAPTE